MQGLNSYFEATEKLLDVAIENYENFVQEQFSYSNPAFSDERLQTFIKLNARAYDAYLIKGYLIANATKADLPDVRWQLNLLRVRANEAKPKNADLVAFFDALIASLLLVEQIAP